MKKNIVVKTLFITFITCFTVAIASSATINAATHTHTLDCFDCETVKAHQGMPAIKGRCYSGAVSGHIEGSLDRYLYMIWPYENASFTCSVCGGHTNVGILESYEGYIITGGVNTSSCYDCKRDSYVIGSKLSTPQSGINTDIYTLTCNEVGGCVYRSVDDGRYLDMTGEHVGDGQYIQPTCTKKLKSITAKTKSQTIIR